jgi:hypothetical protein
VGNSFATKDARQLEWPLSEAELSCKRKMFAAYASQSGLAAAFPFGSERFASPHGRISPSLVVATSEF